ncbi:hypothetical protein SEA_MOLEFICENT_49 [Microbacterium phage Moleficent]|nr:hypothetical protein SEA_MOLEFICENT_49 [Microbacterium phage Moleficent]
MPPTSRPRTRSLGFLALTQRFRRLSTSFTLRRTKKKLLREQKLLNLLEMEQRHRLLRLKELQQEQQMMLHRLEELTPSLSPVLQISSSEPSESSPKLEPTVLPPLKISPMLQELLDLPPKESTPPQ